jgi:hypothetical protein
MSSNLPPNFCPYKGLQPYTEQDRTFFFGRDRDQQIIISNLCASPLTVFYGASGVGKSSVLLAGAVPLLKEESKFSVVVFRNWQDPDFLSRLKQQAFEATKKKSTVDFSLPFDEFLAQLWQSSRGSSFFVLDQFEEYFLYNPTADGNGFEAEFARAVNRRDVTTNFLLSMREDSLSKLDRFQGRIPTLMNNMLRLDHLDRDSAKEAITKPLDVYNNSANGGGAITIESSLISAILDDLQAQVDDEVPASDKRVSQEKPPGAIETPFLQMVLTRLWDEEHAAKSHALRMQTYAKLGRATNIAKTHLDTIMKKLTDDEQQAAANVFRYLVTPSGTKIAQEAAALASWTDTTEDKVQPILNRLSGQDVRILRTVRAPGRPVLYELFHDVLAQAALNWRRNYVAAQEQQRLIREAEVRRAKEQEEAERRRERERSRVLRVAIGVLLVVLVVIAGLLALTVWQTRKANQANAKLAAALAEVNQQKDEITQKKNELEAEQHLRKGIALARRARWDDSIQEYDLAIKLNPAIPEAYSYKGYAQIRKGKYTDAIATLQDLTTRSPDYVWGHYNLALAYQKNGQDNWAIQECLKLLALDPTFWCNTFKGDNAYKWVKTVPEIARRCGSLFDEPQPTPPDVTLPGE